MTEEQDRTRDEQEPGDDPGDEISGAEVAEQEPDGEDAEAEAMEADQSGDTAPDDAAGGGD